MASHRPANHYCVSRPVYSKRAFDEDNDRQIPESRSFREKLSASSKCSSSRAKQVLKGLFPILDWLLQYPTKQWLPSDVISGVSTGLVCCLQGLAYALLVSVGPVYGLYAAFFPILTYFFLGTSRHLSVGPFPVTCLMVGSVVLTLAPDEDFMRPGNETCFLYIHITTTFTPHISLVYFLILQLGMGVFHVGFLVRYLSDPLVGGFTTAAAVHVLISQLKMVLSVPTHSHNGFFSLAYVLSDVFRNIKQTNVADLVAGLLTIVTVMAVKEINAKFQHKIPVPIPIEVIVTVVATGISYAVDLNSRYGASIVHSIPRGFVPAQFPNIELFGEILGSSFSTAVVGYAVSVSVAKVYAAKHDYKIDGNQELIAFGISNIFCGCFSGFVATTALSRTAIQESTGGKTQVAGLISALMVLIVIVAVGPLLQPLQKSVLAGIVIANLKGMFMQICDVPILWRQNRTDCFIWVFTCISCIVLGLDVGLLTGVVFELGTVVNGLVPVAPLGVDNEAFESEQDPEHVEGGAQQEVEDGSRQEIEVEVQVDWTSSLPVNVTVPKVNIHSLVMDFSAVSFLDMMSAKSLRLVIKEFIRIGVSVYIAGCDDDTVRRMEALCFFDDVVTRDLLFLTVHDAILFIKLEASNGNISDPMVDKISQMQDDKEPLPFTEDEDRIETYDNQHLVGSVQFYSW
uniref:STAS domain-containing protein n=1 Tax=Pygocentrus nattereri TaxID=42514 RepID=A0AAR2JSD3_PYGNA